MIHDDDVARTIARLSVTEIKDALRTSRAPTLARSLVGLVARPPSVRLGRLLARFDAMIERDGITRAAARTLDALGARVHASGACPQRGAVLVVTNHPGAYDALATIATLGRADVALIAADRAFLRAMPRLSEHLVFVAESGEDVRARALATRRALDWLARGGALIQFGAGRIEPDAAFATKSDPVLEPWTRGTGLLASRAARAGAAIVPCFVSGVHSPRAKRLSVVKWAERRGITTLAPLVQATLPGFRDVAVHVRVGAPIDASQLRDAGSAQQTADLVRAAVLALRER